MDILPFEKTPITRREKAIQKIIRLERQLDSPISDKKAERIMREITRLQIIYNIEKERKMIYNRDKIRWETIYK